MLDIAQLLLDFPDLFLVTRVLTHIITEFDSRAAIRSCDLDDYVERLGLFAS